MKKVAIFDFCETLCDFQTADAYVDYVREHSNHKLINIRERVNVLLRKSRLLDVACILTRFRYPLGKLLKLRQLKGLSLNLLEEMARGYYEEEIRPHLIPLLVDKLREHQEKGHEVLLISGGYGIYLKYFAEEYGINMIISSNIGFDVKGRCTGSLKGSDCMNENKVKLLRQIVPDLKDDDIVASYSDSSSDIPILCIAQQSFVVSRNHQPWVDNYNFNEIIWTYNR